MPLFLDRLLAGEDFVPCVEAKYLCSPAEWRGFLTHTRGSFSKAVPFEISNVAEYFYLGTEQEIWDLFEDFPGAIPPFSETWLEWRIPAKTNSNGEIKALVPNTFFQTNGCCLSVEDFDKDILKANAVMYHAAQTGLILIGAVCCFGIRKTNGAIVSTSEAFAGHKLLGSLKGEVGYVVPGTNDRFRKEAHNDGTVATFCSEECSMLYPAMLAISLMNCRNVKVRDVANTRQLVRHAERHGKPITRSYKVIEIQPFIAQAAAATGDHGYSREAAKIIRGHFKDYTRGEGLFGSIKGRFWWGQQLHGKVKRDFHYELADKGPGTYLNTKWYKGKKRRA